MILNVLMGKKGTVKRGEKTGPGKEMSVLEHLGELRSRLLFSLFALIIGTIVVFSFYDHIYRFFFIPFLKLRVMSFPGNEKLFINTLFEGFTTKLKLSVIVGAILSSPVHLYNILAFTFPGLRPVEKKVFILSLLSSFVLIVGSVYYSYFKIIPIAIQFLTSRGFVPRDIGLLLNYQKNVLYVLQFIIITLVIFQLPIVLEITMIFGLIKRRRIVRASRFVIVGIFVLSALLTPPDFISQVAIALPLILLFFITIGIAKIFSFGE